MDYDIDAAGTGTEVSGAEAYATGGIGPCATLWSAMVGCCSGWFLSDHLCCSVAWRRSSRGYSSSKPAVAHQPVCSGVKQRLKT